MNGPKNNIKKSRPLMNTTEMKAELLKKYEKKEPTGFLQYDGFVNCMGGDCFSAPDQDKDDLFSGSTFELMHGSNVRVLILQGTGHDDALRVLKKITAWIEKDEGAKEHFESDMKNLSDSAPSKVSIKDMNRAAAQGKAELAHEIMQVLEPDVSNRVRAILQSHLDYSTDECPF